MHDIHVFLTLQASQLACPCPIAASHKVAHPQSEHRITGWSILRYLYIRVQYTNASLTAVPSVCSTQILKHALNLYTHMHSVAFVLQSPEPSVF
jgi:hypothetical protein